MTESQKAEAYDLIRDLVIDAKKTEAFFSGKKDMEGHTDTIRADAFRRIVKRFFGDVK